MKIAVLHDSPRPTWSSRRLLKAIENLGHRPSYIVNSMLSVSIGGTPCSVYLGAKCLDIDAVIVRSIGRNLSLEVFLKRIAVLYQLELEGVTVVNPVNGILRARDKYMSLLLLSVHGIPVPRTILTEDSYVALRFLEEQISKGVVKPLIGSMGLGSFYVDEPDMGFRVFSAISSLGQPIYLQEYIEKNPNRDIRAFVVGDRVVASIYRISNWSWKTNISQGGRAVPAKLDSKAEEIAVKASRTLGLEYSGVDIIEHGNEYYVLEVNVAPQWRGLQSASGVDPAPLIVKHVVELAKK